MLIIFVKKCNDKLYHCHIKIIFLHINIYYFFENVYGKNSQCKALRRIKSCNTTKNVDPSINIKRLKRDIYINKETNWTKPIKYFIGKGLFRSKIISVINFLQKSTCLSFEESAAQKTSEAQIEYILTTDVCIADVGKRTYGKNTIVDLTYYCSESFGTVAHETLHALGVGHEHQRADRDKFIKIITENIKERFINHILSKHENLFYTFYDIPYDYGSIMHYKKNSFSKNGKDTIEAKNIYPYTDMIGDESHISFNDMKLVNYYYCRKECSSSLITCKNGGYIREPRCFPCICPEELEGNDCGRVKDRSQNCTLQTLIAERNVTYFSSKEERRCVFYIKASERKSISISLRLVETRKREVCIPNVGLEIKYLNDKSITGLCLCGSYRNIAIYSESNEVIITYTGLDETNMFEGYYGELPDFEKYKNKLCYNGKCYKDNKEVDY
uniref:Metalloendopeptidase n=1 Tax=Parastrongyloides trichosuri TaxID=131310 RepID=A0A0N5A5S3_PARTI